MHRRGAAEGRDRAKAHTDQKPEPCSTASCSPPAARATWCATPSSGPARTGAVGQAAASRLRRIEREAEYVKVAQRRIAGVQPAPAESIEVTARRRPSRASPSANHRGRAAASRRHPLLPQGPADRQGCAPTAAWWPASFRARVHKVGAMLEPGPLLQRLDWWRSRPIGASPPSTPCAPRSAPTPPNASPSPWGEGGIGAQRRAGGGPADTTAELAGPPPRSLRESTPHEGREMPLRYLASVPVGGAGPVVVHRLHHWPRPARAPPPSTPPPDANRSTTRRRSLWSRPRAHGVGEHQRSPSRHSRTSLPTRSAQPGGTISGRWQISRALR